MCDSTNVCHRKHCCERPLGCCEKPLRYCGQPLLNCCEKPISCHYENSFTYDNSIYLSEPCSKIPFSCIEGPITQVCMNCTALSWENCLEEWKWYGKYNIDCSKNLKKFVREKCCSGNRGILKELCRRTNCSPEILKYFLLSKDMRELCIDSQGGEKWDPHKRYTRLPHIPFTDYPNSIRPQYDKYGNLIGDAYTNFLLQQLLQSPHWKKDKKKKNLSRNWLNEFYDFYNSMVGPMSPSDFNDYKINSNDKNKNKNGSDEEDFSEYFKKAVGRDGTEMDYVRYGTPKSGNRFSKKGSSSLNERRSRKTTLGMYDGSEDTNKYGDEYQNKNDNENYNNRVTIREEPLENLYGGTHKKFNWMKRYPSTIDGTVPKNDNSINAEPEKVKKVSYSKITHTSQISKGMRPGQSLSHYLHIPEDTSRKVGIVKTHVNYDQTDNVEVVRHSLVDVNRPLTRNYNKVYSDTRYDFVGPRYSRMFQQPLLQSERSDSKPNINRKRSTVFPEFPSRYYELRHLNSLFQPKNNQENERKSISSSIPSRYYENGLIDGKTHVKSEISHHQYMGLSKKRGGY